MRTFSDFEKNLVCKMIELDDKSCSLNILNNTINLFDGNTDLNEHCYIELKSEKNVCIKIKKQLLEKNGVEEWLKKIDNDILKKLLAIVTLFQYLENEKLAYFIGDINLNSLGKVCSDIEYGECEFIDDDLKPLIFKYSRKKIFVSQTLRALKKNDFKTDEELRHEAEINSMKNQLNLTRWALGGTFIGLIVSIIIPIFTTSSVEVKSIEFGNSQHALVAIENRLQKMNELDNSKNILIEHIESDIHSLKESIDGTSSILYESHRNKMQQTTDSED